jgi:hypothetical protein
MYKTFVRPVLTGASETWVLSKADERWLGLSKSRVLEQGRIRILGGRDITMNSIGYLMSQI